MAKHGTLSTVNLSNSFLESTHAARGKGPGFIPSSAWILVPAMFPHGDSQLLRWRSNSIYKGGPSKESVLVFTKFVQQMTDKSKPALLFKSIL